eukprot:Skav221349  [mRNA]  locus=scaffold1845:160888:167139:- [translate_table: standard]
MFEHQQARIDFVCIRNVHADATARRPNILSHHPLVPLTGARHFPLLLSLSFTWFQHSTSTSTRWNYKQRQQVYQHWHQQDEAFLEATAKVSHHLSSIPTASLLKDFDQLHRSVDRDVRPLGKVDPQQAPVGSSITSLFAKFAQHTDFLRHHHGHGLSHIFHAWFHVIQRARTRRQMNSHARQTRALRLQHIMQIAESAAQANDHRAHFQAIRKLSPKVPYKRVQLRDLDGRLLDACSSADCVAHWLETTYSSSSRLPPPSTTPWTWPFSREALDHGLEQLPANKSLAPDFAPAPIWKALHTDLSSALQPALELWTLKPSPPPSSWITGHLVFLPKPGKSGTRPEHLRPITLLEPVGKTLMGVFSEYLMDEIEVPLRRLPTFAYMRQRGGADALHRLALHCDMVRQLLHHWHPIHAAAAGVRDPSLQGGLLVSLDLSQAFDVVDRPLLFSCLRDFELSEPLLRFLHFIYAETYSEFVFRGQHRRVQTHRGIRQGCKAAPALWAAWVGRILQKLCHETTSEWVLRCITAYADDIIAHCTIHCLEDVHIALRRIGCLFDLLRDFGLTVNVAKTVCIFKLRGTATKRCFKKHIERNSQGSFLLVPTKAGITRIKLVSSHVYLGITLSYGPFELQSTQHRIKAATAASHQLHRWLFSQRGLTRSTRHQLWMKCVFTSLTYGVLDVGITDKCLTLLDQQFLQGLRRIYRDVTHLTHRSHAHFLHHWNIPDPLYMLLHLCRRRLDRESLRSNTLQPDDILHLTLSPDWPAVMNRIERFTQARRAETSIQAAMSDVHTCTHCGMTFSDLAHLRRHLTLVHHERAGRLRLFTCDEFSYGVPTCTRCHATFSTWSSFRYHIVYVCPPHPDRSPDLEPLQEPMDVLRQRQREARHFGTHHLQGLAAAEDFCSFASVNCLLCNRFCSNPTALQRHWSTDHAGVWRNHGDILTTLAAHCSANQPCDYCGQDFKVRHSCPVVRQIALLMTFDQGEPATVQVDATPAAGHYICNVCSLSFSTKHGLQKHHMQYHRVTQPQDLSPLDRVLLAQFRQAVCAGRCSVLLKEENVLLFLMKGCRTCGKEFKQRNLLTRHFRQHHSMIWKAVENMVTLLEDELRHQGLCFCRPQMRTKHVCVVFQQFAIQKLTLQFMASSQITPPVIEISPMPPLIDLCHLVCLCLQWGCLELVLNSHSLRATLSRTCLLCDQPWPCFNNDLMLGHLHRQHGDEWRSEDPILDMLYTHCYERLGCMCHPSHGDGANGWNCALLRHLTMLHRTKHHLLIPCPMDFEALMVVLLRIFPVDQADSMLRKFMLRRWTQVVFNPTLLHALRDRCVLCMADEAPPRTARELADHLLEDHQQMRPVSPLMRMLSDFLHQFLAPGPFCPLCGESVADWTNHFVDCHVVLQLSMLLNHIAPVGFQHEQPAIGGLWRQRTLDDCFVGPSELTKDAFSSCLAQFCEQFFDDPMMKELATHRCLLCDALLISADNLWKHLHSHHWSRVENMYDWIVNNLTQHVPCRFCTRLEHSPQHSHRCLSLLNLITLLYGDRPRDATRRRRDAGHLEACGSSRCFGQLLAADAARHSQQADSQQTPAPKSGRHTAKPEPGLRPTPCSGTPCATTGEHDQHLVPRTSIHPTPGCGTTGDDSFHAAEVAGVASRPTPIDAAAPCAGLPSSEELSSKSHHDAQLPSGRRFQEELCEPGDPERRGEASLSHMAPPEEVPSSDGEEPDSGGIVGSVPTAGEARGGSISHAPLSFDEEAPEPAREEPNGPTLGMDCLSPQRAGPVGDAAEALISRHLATHPGQTETSGSPTQSIGADGSTSALTSMPPRMFALRVMLNPNAKQCYLHSPLMAASWLGVILGKIDGAFWGRGFPVIWELVRASMAPFDLCRDRNFLGLIADFWPRRALMMQHDSNEFIMLLLQRLKPDFLNLTWVPSLVRRGECTDTHLSEECGGKFSPLEVNIHALHTHSCTPTDLMTAWADIEGLQRALISPSLGLAIMIHRGHELGLDDTQVCLEQLTFGVPCFQPDSVETTMLQYALQAVVIHQGSTLHSGHYSVIVRTADRWLHYRDGALPMPRALHSLTRDEKVLQLWATQIS